MGNQIGQGSFGVVYVATDKKSGALVRSVVRGRRSINVSTYIDLPPPLNIFRLTPHVHNIFYDGPNQHQQRAIKQIRCRCDGSSGDSSSHRSLIETSNQQFTWDEMKKMRELQSIFRLPYHDHIVQLYEVDRSHQGTISLVMEYMSQGTLLDLMEDQPSHSANGESPPISSVTTKTMLSHHIVRHLVHQILLGVHHLHAHQICHRDLKPENILLGPNYLCKVADFSLARSDDETTIPTSYVSTRWYRAPELLLRSTQYGRPVDIWAIGCIAAELYTRAPLFPGRDECDQLHQIFTAIGTPQSVHWEEGVRLLRALNIRSWQSHMDDLKGNPRNFMVKTLGSHPFFSSENIESKQAVEFLLTLLTLDPAHRIDTNTALRHDYFTDHLALTTTTTAVQLDESLVFQQSRDQRRRQVTQPSNTFHDHEENDKENGGISPLPTHRYKPPVLGRSNRDTTTVISPLNHPHACQTTIDTSPQHRLNIVDVVKDHDKNHVVVVVDGSLEGAPSDAAVRSVLLRHNPYKKGRIR